MNIKHKYDYYGRKEPSPVFLAKPGKRLYCGLSGIDESNCQLKTRTNNTATLNFSIDKYIDGEINSEYDYIDEYMELFCSGIWFKIMEPPSITYDGLRETKDVMAESYEIMLIQYSLKTFLINMGVEGSYEMMYKNEHDKSKFYQVKFYDPKEPKLSLLHLVLAHADVPGWKIGYVDNITPDEQGVFLPDAICNFEVDNKSVYAFLTQDVAQAYKCVFEFDTVNMLINVYKVESLGKDTNVVVGFRNIQNNITTTRDDSLVTQFFVEGLDGYNIESYNFKSNIIEDLSFFTKEPYMDKILQDKYNAWVKYKESRREEFAKLSKEYNGYLTELTELTYRVPVDSAQNNWFGRKLEDLKSAYNDNIAIIKGLEKLYVDSDNNFDLEALKKSHDWPLYESIMNYTLPSIVAAMQAKDEKVEGFGKGNIISCVNPVVMGDDWLYIGADKATFDTIQLDDAPAWGITRAVKVTGTGGIRQKNISVEKTQLYVLSCFVKGSGTFYLEFGDTGKDRQKQSFNINSSGWQRVYHSFKPGSKLVDIAFTGSNFTVCGMQLEMGAMPSQFGYFIQSENILKAYETDWKLYGISELKIKVDVYTNSAEELKKNGYAGEYNPLADYEEAYFTQMHQLYLDYIKLAQEAQAALDERQKEYDAIKAKQDAVEEKRNKIVSDVAIENFGTIQTELDGFTADELYIIRSLYNQSLYTNENVIVTSLDDTVDAVDKQKRLFNEAVEQLYIESHPQYIYEDSISNIYALPEFSEFHGELQVNNFIRVGLTDKLYVKLRVIEISFNPMTLDENMDIVFSNVIQYKSKGNDFSSLLNESGNASNRNGGRVNSVDKNNTTDYVITAEVIKQIFSNPLFGSIISGSTVGGSGSGGTITADKIVAELVKAKEGVFDKLTADTAFIKYLESKLIVSDKIVTGILQADKAQIEELSATLIKANVISADVANIKQLLAGHAGIGDLSTINLTANNVTINEAVIKDMIAAKISVADLMAHTASAKEIVLVSSDGEKPTIAFKDSTQQFYDAKGNVRVQIGQDGSGKFNFIVRGEDGKTALMDENGIHREGIPDGTIINNMIDANTISKDKMNFPIVETDENGNVSITHIYDGNEMFGVKYEKFQTEVNGKFDDLANKVKEISLYADGQTFINDNENIIPKTIKVYGMVRGAVRIAHWYIDGTETTEGVAADKSFILIPHTKLNKSKTSMLIKATDADGRFFDTISLYYIYSGIKGVGVDSVQNYYLASNKNSGITHDSVGWTPTVQEMTTDKMYLWNYEITTYTDHTTYKSDPCIIGVYGTTGQQGVGILDIEEYYQISDSNTTPPEEGWGVVPPQMTTTKRYLWNYEKITYTNNGTELTAKRIIGVYGDKGQTGEDGYTLFLTNQNDNYVADTKGNIKKQIQKNTRVVAYKGTKALDVTIGEIAPVPGMQITVVKDSVTFTALVGDLLPASGSITIPVTVEGKIFSLVYSYNKIADTSGELDDMRTVITEVQSTVDTLNGEIKNKVSQTIFDDSQKAINNKFTNITQNVDTITQEVSNVKTEFGNKITANTTKIEQTAGKLELIATGDSTTSLTLTDAFIKLVSKNVSINAENLNVDAIVNIINTASPEDYGGTKINGGVIDTNTVNAMLIRAGVIQSANYKKGTSVFSEAGTKIDMNTGAIEAKTFSIDVNGNAYFKGAGEFAGKITASSGHIGGENGFIIDSGKLYSGKESFDSQNHGVYIGTDGISINGRNPLTATTGGFSVDKYGNMIAKSGTFSGELDAATGTFSGELSAVTGRIGGFIIGNNSLYSTNVEISPTQLRYGSNFIVTSDGKLTATGADIKGKIIATEGEFNGTINATGGIFKGDVLADTMVAKNAYYIYTNDFTDKVPVYKNKIIMGEGIGGNMFNSVTFGLNLVENSSQELIKPYINFSLSNGFSDISMQSNVVNINSSVNVYKGLDVIGGSFFAQNFSDQNIVPSKCIRWENNASFHFDHQGYGHTHTIIANSGGTKAIAIGDGANAPIVGDEQWCILPYNITATKDNRTGQSEISSIGRDRSGTINIGYDGYRFNCLYVKSINLNGVPRSTWPSGGNGTSDYNNLNNKPQINGHTLTGNQTSSTLGLASSNHSHNNYLTSSSLNGYVTTSQLGNYYTKSETYTKAEVNNLVQDSGGSSSAPNLVTTAAGGVRPPISTGTGATQKIDYITANNEKRLNVQAQFGNSTYSTMYVTLGTSDKRLKSNILPSNVNALSLINLISLHQFNWKQDGKHQKIGVIADELEALDNDLVYGGGYDEDGTLNVKSVDSFYLQGYEIKAIQELSQYKDKQQREIQELKNIILQLQGEISILKQKMIS